MDIVDKLLRGLGMKSLGIDTGIDAGVGRVSTGIDPLKLSNSSSIARNKWNRSGAWKNLSDGEKDTELHDAASSNVEFYQWDDEDNKLIIGFLNGSVYEYDCPYTYFKSLENAPSKGKWVWNNLRPYDLKRNRGSDTGPRIPYRRIK